MATSSSMSKWSPKPTGVRDPRDSSKRNGLFHNPPRYQYLGGAPGPFSQAGSRKPAAIGPEGSGQNAVGPITDRGRGRGR